MAVPKRKMSRSATQSRQVGEHAAQPSRRTRCARTAERRGCRTRCAATAAGTGAGRCSTSSDDGDALAATAGAGPWPVIALDAMGGDRAPDEIVAGGLRAATELDVDILLVGPARRDRRRTCPTGDAPAGVELLPAHEVIAMDDEPASAVRTKKDSSLVRCAEAVRDGRAAGDGRRRQHRRHDGRRAACAWAASAACSGPRSPCRCPCSGRRARAASSLDAGATVDPEPAWLVQWAHARPRVRAGAARRRRTDGRAALERRRSRARATRSARRRSALLSEVKGFIGNVEGPRSPARRRRRDRHRRLHRQRRAEDRSKARCSASPVSCSRRARRARVRSGRPTTSSSGCSKPRRRCCPTTPAARCCSA